MQQLRPDSFKFHSLTHNVRNYKWSALIAEDLCFKVLKMSAHISKIKIKLMKCVAFINFYLYVQQRSSRGNLWDDMAFIQRKWI